MPEKREARLNTRRIIWAALSLLVILGVWWQVVNLNRGIRAERFTEDGIPFIRMLPDEGEAVPGVIVSHGFMVSKQIMLGYGYALARAGYGVLLPDFAGHGANASPLSEEGNVLQETIDAAYRVLARTPGIDRERVALLGQSMGSGAVMQAGFDHPDRYRAVVAVSPTGADVDETRPHNLMLQAGQLEGRFVENGLDILERAGGENDELQSGAARAFYEIPRVEHITILFNPLSQRLAVEWLDQTFERNSQSTYTDRRLPLFGLHIAGWLGLILALKPLLVAPAAGESPPRSRWRRWLGLPAAALIAAGVLAAVTAAVDPDRLLGMSVGGAMIVWFSVFGCVWLFAGFKTRLPRLRSLFWGLILFAVLWVALGLLAQMILLQWMLIPERLLRWPLLSLACLPWLLAAGYAQQQSTLLNRIGWWLSQSVIVTGVLLLTAFVVPQLFVLILIAPVLPLVFAIMSIAGVSFNDAWSFGLGNALFLGWVMAALFPLI